MASIDSYATILLEQAKRFLEKARAADCAQGGRDAFLASSLLLGAASLEAHVNAVADELRLRRNLSVLEHSILGEKDFAIEAGVFTLTGRLKMYRLQDRLEFVFTRFSKGSKPRTQNWWSGVASGLDARNSIVHAKDAVVLTVSNVDRFLSAVLDCLDALYRAVYRKRFPSYRRGLDSDVSF